VLAEADEPPFHEDWERRVFALSFCSWFSAGVAVDESRRLQASMPYARYYGSSYYERWLYSLERLVEQGRAEGAPLVEPERLAAATTTVIERGVERLVPAVAEPLFEAGDRIRVRRANPPHYARLPSYLKGCAGTVDVHDGCFRHPERLARGELDAPGAHCYRVRFEAGELWGEDAEDARDSLCVDLFENYLEPL
jgi:nitrile hydratase